MKIPYNIVLNLYDIYHLESLQGKVVEVDIYEEANSWEITITIPKDENDND